MSDYSPQEEQVIRDAWARVEHLTNTSDHEAGAQLRRALTLEHRALGIYAAKGLLCECIANAPSSMAALYGMTDGCRDAYILAAHWRETKPALYAELLPHLQAAAAANYTGLLRRLEAL